ncbi:MAG: hypothetical protein AAB885_02575 [Patescibacteria group bacterium]
MTKQNKKIEERRSGVILESIDSKLDLVVEGHHSLDKKIDKVDGKVDSFKKDMDYKFEIVLDELRIIRNELKEKVSREEFALLEKKVLGLEKAINKQN